jgi:hypothetical protein
MYYNFIFDSLVRPINSIDKVMGLKPRNGSKFPMAFPKAIQASTKLRSVGEDVVVIVRYHFVRHTIKGLVMIGKFRENIKWIKGV